MKNDIYKLPKDFWIQSRPNKTEKDPDEDMIPFEWSKDELPEHARQILFPKEKENC